LSISTVVRAWRWFAAVRLYGPEKLTENSERRVDRLRTRSTARRRWALQWLLVFLAVLSAWFVLFSTGSLAGDHREEGARSVVAEALNEDEAERVAEVRWRMSSRR
jgi:hypothetical protein